MRTTLDLPHELLEQAMELTRAQTKTEVITIALQSIIRREKQRQLLPFHGKIDLKIDLDTLRQR